MWFPSNFEGVISLKSNELSGIAKKIQHKKDVANSIGLDMFHSSIDKKSFLFQIRGKNYLFE
jgi:hypothetical protein